MRILLIEDSPHLRLGLVTALQNSGYQVETAEDGVEGLWRATTSDYEVIVLDLMLPKCDGYSVLAGLRRAGRDAHVLILTACDTVADRVRGLQEGADDYLVKPFALGEFLARVQAIRRRASGGMQRLLTVGDLEIDTVKRGVRRAGARIDLTTREYLILEFLARRRGEIVTREDIETAVYETGSDRASNVIDSAICGVRKKLAMADAPPIIHTRRGFGYVLEAPALTGAHR
jgi:DNA-binding response OmpR family regulator